MVRVMKYFAKSFLIVFLLTSCSTNQEHQAKDLVLQTGDRLKCGEYLVTATSKLKRTISWDGISRDLELWPRFGEWDGHFGAYYPGVGDHWKDHNGVSRCVYDESIVFFADKTSAATWLSRFSWFENEQDEITDGQVYLHCKIDPSRNQLNIWLYRVEIGETTASSAEKTSGQSDAP